MVTLNDMTELEYESFKTIQIELYAKDKIKAGSWSIKEANKKAKDSFNYFVPYGMGTENHYFYSILDTDLRKSVGGLWFTVVDKNQCKELYIMQILIYEEYRKSGYGKTTMSLLETHSRKLGVRKILLHSMAHNEAAINLYKRCGYKIVEVDMLKEL